MVNTIFIRAVIRGLPNFVNLNIGIVNISGFHTDKCKLQKCEYLGLFFVSICTNLFVLMKLAAQKKLIFSKI